MEYQDYYKTLGVDKNADDAEIKKAYRRLARKYHPDVSKEANAEAKFKEVNEAYEVLRDKEKRQAYDQLGPNWKAGQDFKPPPGWEGMFSGAEGFHQAGGGFSQQQFSGGGFSDFFESLFGGGGFQQHRQQQQYQQQYREPMGEKGADINAKLAIDIADAYHGATKSVNLRVPAKNQFGHTEMKLTNYKVKIPKGIEAGKKIRLKGKGGSGSGHAEAGDLLLEIQFKKDPKYRLENKDIIFTLPVTPWEAALGATIPVKSLVGNVNVKVPAESQSGKKLRMQGKGMPGNPNGDFYYQIQIVNPTPLNAEQKQAFSEFSHLFDYNPREE